MFLFLMPSYQLFEGRNNFFSIQLRALYLIQAVYTLDCPCLSLRTFQNLGRFGTCPLLWQVWCPILHLVKRSPVGSAMF